MYVIYIYVIYIYILYLFIYILFIYIYICVCVVDLAIHYTSRLTGIPICYHYDPLQLGLRTSATASKKLGSKDRTT